MRINISYTPQVSEKHTALGRYADIARRTSELFAVQRPKQSRRQLFLELYDCRNILRRIVRHVLAITDHKSNDNIGCGLRIGSQSDTPVQNRDPFFGTWTS